jgi:hypothetical protein
VFKVTAKVGNVSSNELQVIVGLQGFSVNDNEFITFKSDNSILSLSLRLYPKIIYCHPMQKYVNVPQSIDDNLFIWECNGKFGDWGYPMSLDGNIFRKLDIINYIMHSFYNNPNSFEAAMAMYPPFSQKLICYQQSKIFNLPINRVQNTFDNPSGDVDIFELNNKITNGEYINIDKFRNIENNSCHQEYNIEFIGSYNDI